MPHRRDDIRKILVEALKNKTLAKDNVYNWRIRPVQNENCLPCISVFIQEENVTEISGAGDLIHRKSEVYIIIYNSISNNEDNVSDDIARQVESVVNGLSLKDFIFKYNKTEIFTENISTKVLLLCSLHYSCSYFTEEVQELNADNLEQLSIEVEN